MADRRMFSKSIIDSDLFLDMPQSAQCLYFHLGMRADDDGFVNSPKKIQRIIGASNDDFKLLIAKQFVIPFESGVVVIKHWRIHNYIQKDRYKPTIHQEEKQTLFLDKSGSYQVVDTDCIQDVSEMDNQLGKLGQLGQLGQSTKEENRKRFTPPSVDEVRAYCQERKNRIDPEAFVDYYTANGWVQGKGKPIKDWKATVRTWESREKKKRQDDGPERLITSEYARRSLERAQRDAEMRRMEGGQ